MFTGLVDHVKSKIHILGVQDYLFNMVLRSPKVRDVLFLCGANVLVELGASRALGIQVPSQRVLGPSKPA